MNIVPTKLRYFHDKGLPIKGVIHVGLSWGEEVPDYFAMGASHVIGFEPLPEALEEARKYLVDYPNVRLVPCALGDFDQTAAITEIDDEVRAPGWPVGTGGSTLLKELIAFPGRSDQVHRRERLIVMRRFDTWLREHTDVSIEDYNALVIDVQGMELNVLRGFGDLLHHFEMLNIECSKEVAYEGGAKAQDVIDYLAKFGFKQMTPICDHNDILFQRP